MNAFNGTLMVGADTFDVSGEWEVKKATSGKDDWRGRISADDGRKIAYGTHLLILPDLQRLSIIVYSHDVLDPGTAIFNGNGPLPK